MKKCFRMLIALTLCALLFAALGIAASAETGWQEDVGGRYYVDPDGSRHSGWLLDGGEWYYLDPYMLRNELLELGGKWYYLQPDGRMARSGWVDRGYDSWVELVNERYYAASDGALAMGWRDIDGKRYYFEPAMACSGPVSYDEGNTFYYFRPDGTLADDGWQEDRWGDAPEDAGWYYANPDGTLAQGWRKIDGYWYFLTPARMDHGADTLDGGKTWYFFYDDGKMAQNERVHERYTYYGVTTENWYIADENGRLYLGWLAEGGYWYYYGPWMYKDGTAEINGKSYSFDAQGRWTGGTAPTPGWNKRGGQWYYYDENLKALTYWQQIGGKWYYFNGSGVMQTGWLQSGGHWYYLDGTGAMRTGWLKLDGKWYYLGGDGVMVTYWQQIGGKWYYFNGSGVMQTGWLKSGGKWFYFDGSGAMQTGWLKTGGKWYYLGSDGAMRTYWQQIGGKWYYFNGSGVMQTGWLKSGGSWYYFDTSGAMLAGCTRTIDGKLCRFDASGRWIP